VVRSVFVLFETFVYKLTKLNLACLESSFGGSGKVARIYDESEQ
jgi:hypothetical protein